MTPPLDGAIRALYSTFSRYDAADLSCCDWLDDDPRNVRLRSTRLDRLDTADLDLYARKAMTTWGGVEDFKHFLPRLLELLARDGQLDVCEPEVLLGKLAYGRWARWPAAEQAAVTDYLRALWRHLRQGYPCALSADSFLCGLGNCVDDLHPWLADWDADPDVSLPSALHLADLVEYNVRGALSHKRPHPHPANAFWKLPSRPAEQFWSWLTAPARITRLEAAFFAHGSSEAADRFSTAISHLEALRARTAAQG
jgi:hypothetical protein